MPALFRYARPGVRLRILPDRLEVRQRLLQVESRKGERGTGTPRSAFPLPPSAGTRRSYRLGLEAARPRCDRQPKPPVRSARPPGQSEGRAGQREPQPRTLRSEAEGAFRYSP